MEEIILKLENITKIYPNGTVANKDINIEVHGISFDTLESILQFFGEVLLMGKKLWCIWSKRISCRYSFT